MRDEQQRLLRALPSIDALLASEELQPLLARHPRPALLRAARAVVEGARARILAGDQDVEVGASGLERYLRSEERAGLRRVVNATGVILHTNLGRAPLPPAALEAIAEACRGFSNLELDLETGKRGKRHGEVASLLRGLLGVEAALVVNNNAGAVLLALSALASGKGCVVSRGELVEIGGGFRIPDVMAQAGARLVEVGTTNRTRLADYQGAIDEETGLLMKILPSNFTLVGFTEEASISELAALAKERGVPLYVDLGAGYLRRREALPDELTVQQALEQGADVVSFSGDKILGGPQAGFLVGTAAALSQMERHPLMRALRMDKLGLTAAEATLRLYRDEREEEIPAMSMLEEDLATLEGRAQTLARLLEERGVTTRITKTTSVVGGGAAPGAAAPSAAVALLGDAEALQAELRRGSPPVIARLEDDRVLLDMRTIQEAELVEVADAVATAKQNVEGVYV